MKRALHWLRARMGVRVVSALAAAAAVAVVLVVAGVSLVLLLDHQLRQSTESSAESQAVVLGERIAANFTGTSDAKKNAIDATGKRGDIVQVLTDYGDDSDDPDSRVGSNGPQSDVQVIGSSEILNSLPPVVDWLLAPRETRVVSSAVITLADGSTEEVTIVGKGLRATGRPITVLAAQSLKPVHQAVDTVAVMVSIGIPILVLVTGFFTYLFAGRALRPVEAMRRRVAGLTDRDLDRRVPEPHTHDEVGRLARTMNQMLSRLQDSQATQRRFVADASHELRSPLATVSTGLELLGNGMPPDSSDLATVQTLRGETGRLTKLVEGLLFLARADERGLTPRREEVDLDELVEGERVRPSADDTVSVTVSTEPVRVVGDRSQLVRVLRNLVDNARLHATSTVSVSVRSDGELAVIDVDDDGSGIPEADRTRVFERFVRLDEARARGDGGSGLGLAIVAELVSAHGGTVTAGEAETLGGARFRVTVPLSGAPGSPEPAEPAEPAPAAGPAGDPPGSADLPGGDVAIPEQAGRSRRAPAGPAADGTDSSRGGAPADLRGADLFSPLLPADRGTGTGPRASAEGERTASGPVPGEVTAAGPEPVLFDDRPSGPPARMPMGGRRRGAGAQPPEPVGADAGDGASARPGGPSGAGAAGDGADATPVAPVNANPAAPQPESTPPARSRTAGPRPAGSSPIRSTTAGSPADENATRPLPLVRPADRPGTVFAGARRTGGATRPASGAGGRGAPARANGTNGTNGTGGDGSRTSGAGGNGFPARTNGANGTSSPHDRTPAGAPATRRPGGGDPAQRGPRNGHPQGGAGHGAPGRPPRGRGNPSDT